MKSRTIEIIDNHIKALEEELEWYQERNREWQEKCEKLEKPEVFDKYPHFTTFLGKPIDYWITLQQENARLREQLRWHSVDELPKVSEWYLTKDSYGDAWISKYTKKDGWSCDTNVEKWMYIPDDNQGTDCTPEGE